MNDYKALFRSKFPRITEMGIERSILKHWKAEHSTPGNHPYGQTWTHHFCEYVRHFAPRIELNSWFRHMVWSVEHTRFLKERKILNHIGSKNSGKTLFAAVFVNAILSIDPQYSKAYIAAPYKQVANSTVWARALTVKNMVISANPKLFATVYHQKADCRIIYEENPESGFIELVTIDDVGKLQGIKAVDPDRGWLILVCDEVAIFPKKQLLDVLDNVTGNPNFLCLDGCNFRSTEGLEGDLCRPEGREYEDLHPDRDHDWPSAYKSWTFRFDGHLSPNITNPEKRVVSPHLLRESVRKDMEEIHGLTGPKYMEQIRSMPVNSATEFYITTRERVRSSGAYEPVTFTRTRPHRVAFCDPGLGGDPCVIGAFDYGPALIPTLDGSETQLSVFQPIEAFQTIPVSKDQICDQAWIKRVYDAANRYGTSTSESNLVITPGQAVPPEQQVAVRCAEYCAQKGIPPSRFGFDGSMRAEVVQEIVAVMGNQVRGIDFGGKATERSADLTSNKTAYEMYANYVTEMYFAFGTLVQACQFRGADFVPAAINQLVKRWWEWVGARKKIQPKHGKNHRDEDKKSYIYQNKMSPNDADTLIGGLEMARRHGYSIIPTKQVHTSFEATNSMEVASFLANSKRFRPRTGKRLNHAGFS